ncbi:MAG TPA: 16S rRNA (cytidine(1402)-2'-O)-methyltransferase, partial [Acidimicrobiales bacterium]|nr:16S rRNA (cytidine(1402)-2'-O)-methyltransferase [Acidimicrobiales bacterium]
DEAGDGELGGSGDPTGELVLVATPIGNLGDLSPRAVEVLSTADVIYCEDTRHSRKLLTHAGISGVRLRSLHQHNEADRIDEVIGSVAGGRTVAVISDAGTPGISDPGSRVVAAAATAGLKISIVPGPSAGLAALVTSGLATDRFCFDGFLPRSGKERRQRLAALADETRTTVLFEAPTRLAGTLADLADGLGDQRQVAVARELTKLHEEIWRGNAAGAAAWAASKPMRGEVVIVVAGAVEAPAVGVGDGPLQDALEVRLARGERTRGAVDAVAEEFGVARRRVYDLALAVRNATSSPGVEKDGS